MGRTFTVARPYLLIITLNMWVVSWESDPARVKASGRGAKFYPRGCYFSLKQPSSYYAASGILFWVPFFKGAFLPQKWDLLPLFSHITIFFTGSCLFLYLNILPDRLYVFNRQLDIPVLNNIWKRTVWVETAQKCRAQRSCFAHFCSKFGPRLVPIWNTIDSLGKESLNAWKYIDTIESWTRITSDITS
jgi:hypothetical protein